MDSLQCNTVEVVMQGWAVPLPRCGAGAAVPWGAGRRESGRAKTQGQGGVVW